MTMMVRHKIEIHLWARLNDVVRQLFIGRWSMMLDERHLASTMSFDMF